MIARGELGSRDAARYLATVEDHPRQTDAWCSAFAEWCVRQAGMKGPGKPTARAWLMWWQPLSQPRVGSAVVLWRGTPSSWQGHVGFYLSEDETMYSLLGGNQGGQVSIRRYPKHRLLGLRWPSTVPSSSTSLPPA